MHRLLQTIRVPASGPSIRILHFSDLHWRGSSPGRLEREVKACLEDTPADLLVFTGDTVNRQRYWPRVAVWLSSIEHSGLRIAVPGNWDYTRHGMLVEFERVWRDAGFAVLRNRGIRVEAQGLRLEVTGLGDLRCDPLAEDCLSCGGVEPYRRLLLCHSPDILLYPGDLSYDLLLCGHTHGGQIRLPGLGALLTSTRIGRKFDKGLFEHPANRYVFVNSGLGEGQLPFRVGCPPQISLLKWGEN